MTLAPTYSVRKFVGDCRQQYCRGSVLGGNNNALLDSLAAQEEGQADLQ